MSSMVSVMITGAGQGIGKALARRFAQGGARVVIAELDEEAGAETVEELRGLGDVRFVHTDISQEDDVKTAIAHTLEAGGRIDVLVNNAAASVTRRLTDLSLEEWNRVLATNLTGAFLCAKHAAPHLRRASGSIINIASTRAFMSEPNTEAYSASKGGLVALTHALAMSLQPQVRVNCISPGWIEVSDLQKRSNRHAPRLSEEDHAQHPVGRVGRPEDIAALAYFLASPEAGFITGANFTVDGGMTRKMIYV
jgi:NAD(P)-dependent dehydrogenase (short-subunit alcohol dehydrogenase family)